VTSAHGSRYDAALETLRDACGKYRAGLAAAPGGADGGVSPWTPIYADLLEGLLSQVHHAAQDYAEAADNSGLKDADRYDWHGQLTSQDEPGRP
jgi:hypothetical protein